MRNAFLFTPDRTLLDAIRALDEAGIGFLALIDDSNLLVGILTDGDFRRGILEQKTELIDIINTDPITMQFDTPQHEIVIKLKSLHRRHMPLVDKNNIFKGVFSLDDIEFISKENLVVIMAGGLGTRLGDLTKELPKPMLCVGDRPILQHLVEQFRDQGFHQFVFCLNYKKDIIKEYFGNGERLGVKISYVVEEKRMGTAGALSLIKTGLKKPFFVINADVLTNVDFNSLLDFHNEKENVATMCVRQFEQKVPYGVIEIDKNAHITGIKEKPNFSFNVNAGIYALDPIVLKYIPENEFFDMPTLFEKLMANHHCSAFNLHDYWLDIGQKEDFNKANLDMENYL
jgi:dTDP-glucose pyrophosphorylase